MNLLKTTFLSVFWFASASLAFAQSGQESANTSERIPLSDSIDYSKIALDTLSPDPFLDPEYVTINGDIYPVMIQDGDTLILASIDDVSLTSPRMFDDPADYKRYMKYKAYITKVVPYARKAIKIFRQTEYVTQNMKRRKRKKYYKQLSKQLNTEFEDPLKHLTKTQGKILVKMIERELDQDMYSLIKSLRGRWRAMYWNQSSKLFGYRLKDGYTEGDNHILDAVLQDFDISYEVDPKDYDQYK